MEEVTETERRDKGKAKNRKNNEVIKVIRETQQKDLETVYSALS